MSPQRIVDDRFHPSGAKRVANINTPEEDMTWEGRHCRSTNSEPCFIAKCHVCTYKTTKSRLRGSTVNRRVADSDIGRSSAPAFNVRKKVCSRDNSRTGSILSVGDKSSESCVRGDRSDKRDEQPNINFADGQTICMDDFVYAWHRNTKNVLVGIVLGCEVSPRLGDDYPSGGRVNEKRGNAGSRLFTGLYKGGEEFTVSGSKMTD